MKKFMRAILLSTLLLMTTTVNFAADNNLEVVSIFDFANKITDQMDRAKPKYGYYSVPVSLQGDLTGRITSISILKQDADDPSFTEDFSKAINQAAKKYALPKNFFLDNSTVTINFRIQPRGRSSAFVVRTQESPVIPSKGASATFATDAEKEKIIREADKNIAKTNSSADLERVEGTGSSTRPQAAGSVSMDGFQHKNKVWTHTGNTNCDSDWYLQSWVIGANGGLELVELAEDVLTKKKVTEYKQSGNRFLIKYSEGNSIEIYEFREDIFPGYYKKVSGIQMMEQVLDGVVTVKNGLNIQRNQFTSTLRECDSGTPAVNAIKNPPNQVPALAWRWPSSKFEKVSYCAGVLNYASKSSDNHVGKRMADDLYKKAAAVAKRGGVSENNFVNHAERGYSDAAGIYKQSFDKDMKRGKLDPTLTAKSEIRYAVQECQNLL